MNFMTIASQYEKSSFVASMTYIQLIYALIYDLAWFKTEFDSLELLGAGIILVFNLINIGYKLKRDSQESK